MILFILDSLYKTDEEALAALNIGSSDWFLGNFPHSSRWYDGILSISTDGFTAIVTESPEYPGSPVAVKYRAICTNGETGRDVLERLKSLLKYQEMKNNVGIQIGTSNKGQVISLFAVENLLT